jgi:hypothetical protein
MSSLCAADAAFTSAEFAAAMDLAASMIISSKLRFSSASCQQKHDSIGPILQQTLHYPACMGTYMNLSAARVKL